MKTYIIYDKNDIFELPLVVCDSLGQCARWIGVYLNAVQEAIQFQHPCKGYVIEPVDNADLVDLETYSPIHTIR